MLLTTPPFPQCVQDIPRWLAMECLLLARFAMLYQWQVNTRVTALAIELVKCPHFGL